MRKKSLLKGIIPFLAGSLFSMNSIGQVGKLPVINTDATTVAKQPVAPFADHAQKVVQPVAGKLAVGGTDKLVNNNNAATGTSFFTQSETTTIAWGNNVVVGFNDAGSAASGAHFTGWSYSSDGGATFTDGGALPASAIGDGGDPVLARNSTSGRIYFATLGFPGGPETIQVFHSDDNGITWSAPVNGTPGGIEEDKTWMVVDNYPGTGNGTVYLISRRFNAAQGIYLFKSTDNGATFGPAGGTLIASGAAGNVQGAFVVVAPDHTVHAIYFDDVADNIKIRKSTDLGVTFSAPVVVTGGLSPLTNGDLQLSGFRQGTASPAVFRTNSFPHAAVNPTNSNQLYLVYNNNPAGADKADVFIVTSTDAGATWSAPTRVNDDASPADQWMPTIAVMDDGTSLGVFYYSRQEDPVANNLFKYYGRIGTIAGTTVAFGNSFPISDVASLPEFGRDAIVVPTYMGDYNTAVGVNGTYHVSWADNRDNLAIGPPRKDPNVYYDKFSYIPPQISVSPSPLEINVAYGGTGSGTFDISNTVANSNSLDWKIAYTCTWISSVSPAAGSTDGSATSTVTVNVDAAGLACGTYNCELTITSNASNTPAVTLPVHLNVQAPFSCSITSVPENNVFTGGNPNNIYIGYGPQKTTLQSTVTGPGGPFTYSWSPSTGLSSATSAAPVFTPPGPGTYVFTLTVTGTGTCPSTCTITINVYDIRVPGTNGKKIFLCHAPPDNPSNTQTLQVSTNSVQGHLLNHPGDHLGGCNLVIAPRNGEFDVIAEAGIRTYPNPNKGSFELQLDNFTTGKAEVRILNIDGTIVEKRLVNISAASQSVNIELKNKAAGMYYVQVISSSGGVQNSKFVITR